MELETEIFLVAQNRSDGRLPDPVKTAGRGRPEIFFEPGGAEALLKTLTAEVGPHFGLYRAVIRIEERLDDQADAAPTAAPKPPRGLTAGFRPQAWVNDHAMDIDGARDIDITASVLAMSAATIRNIPNVADNDNLYYDSPDHEAIDHGGPFEVDVDEDALCAFFGVEALHELTDEVVEAKRAALRAQGFAVPPGDGQ